MKTDSDDKPGLRIETAASVTVHNFIHDHFARFALTIRRDRLAGTTTAAEYVNGLAGCASLIIAGGHGSKDEVVNMLIAKLRVYVDRDLKHLGR